MSQEHLTDEGLLIGFLQERWKNRGPSYADTVWKNLPNPNDLPGGGTITLFRNDVMKWRDDYAMLVAFAAHICRVPLQDFTPQSVLAYLQKRSARRESGSA